MDQWAEWTECPTVPADESSFSYHNVPYRYRSRHCSHNRYDDDYHTHHDFDADLSHHDVKDQHQNRDVCGSHRRNDCESSDAICSGTEHYDS